MTWPSGAWPAARTNPNTRAEVVVVGDSLTHGSRASDPRYRSMFGLTGAELARRYGNGGTGFVPHGFGTTTGTVSSAFAAGPNGHAVVLDGSDRWSIGDLHGTSVSVFLRRATGDGTARWRVDGGPWQTRSTTGSAGWIKVTADGLAAGVHSVDVEAQTGTVGVFGAQSAADGGVRLHTMGLGLRTSGNVANTGFTSSSITPYAPHLLVVALGVNDSNLGGVTKAAYKANIQTLIAAARAARPDCDVVLVAHHLGKFANNNFDAMVTALYELADTHRAVVVDLDLWARTTPRTLAVSDRNTSWGRWATWGWWGTPNANGPSGSDGVHPGDTGHSVLANVLTKVVTG